LVILKVSFGQNEHSSSIARRINGHSLLREPKEELTVHRTDTRGRSYSRKFNAYGSSLTWLMLWGWYCLQQCRESST
jgi:hypothetical protein